MNLDSGIPTTKAYAACVDSPLFKSLERYSDAFLKRNRTHLLWYSIRWSEDPLNHPTRRWEYPYTGERLTRSDVRRVLDAGSGITFFPYYLMESNPGLTVTCCDRDDYVGQVYDKINSNQAHKVEFQRCDLSSLPFPDGSFDSVYCISVLEHTGNREAIVKEFRRVLRPGGQLIVTFDISLDGSKDIPVSDADALLASLSSNLSQLDRAALDAGRKDIYVTDQGIDRAHGLSPWKLYRWSLSAARSLLSGRLPRTSPMTIYCAEFVRPGLAE
jgi:SAM-dependent methyltransferase